MHNHREYRMRSVILGGTFQNNNWNLSVNEEDKETILSRCYELVPSLKVQHFVMVLHFSDHFEKKIQNYPRIEVQIQVDTECRNQIGRSGSETLPRRRRQARV